MDKFLLHILFLCIPYLFFAQKQKVQLVDVNTKEPLPFVEVLYNNENLFSDKNGNVFIEFTNQNLEVLDGNYHPGLLEISSETKVVYLGNNVTQLEEMVISKKPRTIIKPQSKKIFDRIPIKSDYRIWNEIVFNPEYQNKYLRKISFKTVSELYDTKLEDISNKDIRKVRNATQVFRLNIFDKNKNLLYSSNLFEYLSKKKYNFEIDIEDDILITSESIFVEIQVIGAIADSGEFLDKNIKMSIRPQQVKLKPSEYNVILWSKPLAHKDIFVDENSLNSGKTYINFGFEFEDAD